VSADHRSLEAVPDLGSAAASGTPARFFFITRGLPGCGKSTFAKRFVRTYDGRIARINRDMWRDMTHPDWYSREMTERAVDVGAHAAVRHRRLRRPPGRVRLPSRAAGGVHRAGRPPPAR
jgi:hypothetical protein